MKKKISGFILGALLTIMLVIPFIALKQQINYINSQIQSINSNYLIVGMKGNVGVDSYLGYTTEQLNYLENQDNIEVLKENNVSTIDNSGEDNQGRNSQEIFHFDKNLDYVKGHNITEENGIVISEKLASKLKEDKNKNDISDLLNTEYLINDQTYKIQGIYKNLPTYYEEEYIINDSTLKDDYSYFIKDQINAYNLNRSSLDNEHYEDYVFNEIERVDEEGYEYYEEILDYEASVKNGVTGLVNPQDSSKYPEIVVSSLLIKIKDNTDKAEVISELQSKLGKTTQIISNQTTYQELYGISSIYVWLIILYILINIIMLYRYLKKEKIN
ncbi:MAG: hypothetical protein ACK5HR_01050 [Mycoplasmatales bacterium]